MIKNLTIYTVICDNCGKDSTDECLYSGWSDADYAIEQAEDAGFETIGHEKHYCPDCFYYDDNDELIIKEI